MMALVLKESAQLYRYLVHDLGDNTTKDLPLLHSPAPIAAILAVYLLFVLKWGPEYMKNRTPYNLKKTLIVYNAFQMVYSLTILAFSTFSAPIHEWKCIPIQISTPDGEVLMWCGYAYFILKIFDLLDTVFFVLRKNYRQVTFLHVYHHSSMIFFTWVGIRYVPGGHSIYLMYINSIVHVVMYGYYLLTVYDDKYKKSVWLKKKITQLQLFQFGVIMILYGLPLIYVCGYPKWVCVTLMLMNCVMITLFTNFYYKTYIRKDKQR